MTRTLIFGAEGRLGMCLARHLRERGMDVAACGRRMCDLRDEAALENLLVSSGATHVVNCAAMSGLEACLDAPAEARAVNAAAPELMARVCRREGMRLVHVSTDYVLDGCVPGLKAESAPCRPVSVYGESKLEAELRVGAEMPEAVIARVAWVFGNPERPAFPEMMIARALRREPLAAIADKWSKPCWTEDLCDWLRVLAHESRESGVIHLCRSGTPLSWHGYALLVLESAVRHGLLPCMPVVAEQKLDEQPGFRDARPRHTAMACGRLEALLNRPAGTYEEAIDMAVARYASDPTFPSLLSRIP